MKHAREHAPLRFDDRGATGVEYALIAALVAVVVMVGVALLGNDLLDSFTNSNDTIENAIAGQPTSKGCAADGNGAQHSAGKCLK